MTARPRHSTLTAATRCNILKLHAIIIVVFLGPLPARTTGSFMSAQFRIFAPKSTSEQFFLRHIFGAKIETFVQKVDFDHSLTSIKLDSP